MRRDLFIEVSGILTSQIDYDDEDMIVVERGSVGTDLDDRALDALYSAGFALILDHEGLVTFVDATDALWPYDPRTPAVDVAMDLLGVSGVAGFRVRKGVLWLMDPMDADRTPAVIGVPRFEMALRGRRSVAPVHPDSPSIALGKGVYFMQ